MEMRVPIFAGRRILKKESLWDIRDYTYAGWQLYYAEYTDGLLKGCEIHAEDGRLVIGKGMLKFHDFIYLLMEEEEVAYQPKNRWQVLKAEFLEDDTNLDYKAYRVRFFWMRSWNWARTRWKCAASICGKVRHCVTVIRILRICQPSTIR